MSVQMTYTEPNYCNQCKNPTSLCICGFFPKDPKPAICQFPTCCLTKQPRKKEPCIWAIIYANGDQDCGYG